MPEFEVLAEFETVYAKKTKHRKKCPHCKKLIQDGERVVATKSKTIKYYPVKGIMGFINWKFAHIECAGRSPA